MGREHFMLGDIQWRLGLLDRGISGNHWRKSGQEWRCLTLVRTCYQSDGEGKWVSRLWAGLGCSADQVANPSRHSPRHRNVPPSPETRVRYWVRASRFKLSLSDRTTAAVVSFFVLIRALLPSAKWTCTTGVFLTSKEDHPAWLG